MNKSLIWIGVFLGSTAGGFVPLLWHASLFSIDSIISSALGGFVGIWAAWKINERYL